MKSKNVLSALLAVMMVLSMMTAIAMPAVAAGEKTDLPSIQTATSSDKVTEYAMSSVADLIWWGQNPTAVTASDTVYLTKDLDITAYGPTFKNDFVNIRRTYASLDGQGHTIYGYTNGLPIFSDRYYGKTIRNLIIDSAYVESSQYGACILAKWLEADCLIENVHLRNCKVLGSDSAVTGVTYGYHSLVVGYMNNRKSDFDITFRSCSIVNSTMDCNGWADCGLWVGRFRSGGQIRFENCVTYNSDIVNFTSGSTISAFGWLSDSREVYVDNIGAFNCDMIGAPVSQALFSCSNQEFLYVNNLFSAGNKTSSSIGMTHADIPVSTASVVGYAVDNYLVDGGTTKVTTSTAASGDKKVFDLAVGAALEAMNKVTDINGMDYPDWGFDKNGYLVLVEEGSDAEPIHEVVYKQFDGTVITSLPTDINGNLVIDEATLAVLKSNHWRLENGTQNYANNTPWETMAFNASTSFLAHDTAVAPHETEAKYHTVTCTMDGCEETVEKIPCVGIQQADLYEEAGYFDPAVRHFVCAVCGQTWTADDLEAENPAMITMNFKKDVYDAGEMIALEIGVNADTNLEGFEMMLTYDTEKLSFINYIVCEPGISAGAAESDDQMKIAAYADTPSAEAGRWMTLYFKAADELTADDLVDVASLLTKVVVNNTERSADLKTKTASASTMLYAGCTPGDVNRSGNVDLLDAVMLVDALNGTLDEATMAIFSVRAANVDGDAENTVTTNDVTYLLRNLLDWKEFATLNLARPGTTMAGMA